MDSHHMSGGVGGMNMGSTSRFRRHNQDLASGYWYIIAGLVGFMMLLRAYECYDFSSRFRLSQSQCSEWPTRPRNFIGKAYATATAIGREISYPQFILQRRGVRWLSPPSSGRIIVLLCYWVVIVYMLVSNAVTHDSYYFERIGFRAAWVSVTQVPLVYLLATKSSIIGLLIGSSHERLNWLHRWVSRTLLVTVTIHGSFFFREWVRADFVKIELQMMPMVKYGIGAWFLLLWTFCTSLSPLRRLAYELFVLQHVAAAAVFLWLLWVHVPSYARYNLYLAIAALASDFVARFILLCYTNIRLRVVGPACKGMRRLGHTAQLQATSNDITVITIRDVAMSWKPGQHLYLWLPSLGPLDSHPFTIASPYNSPNKCPCNDVQFAIRAQKGFTKRIHTYAEKMERLGKPAITKAMVLGPYGCPPNWNAYETLILISASTGASYTLPILESVLSSTSTVCIRRIKFLLIARHRRHIEWYIQRLEIALEKAARTGIELDVEIAVTGTYADDASSLEEGLDSQISSLQGEKDQKPQQAISMTSIVVKESSITTTDSASFSEDKKTCCSRSDLPSASITESKANATCCSSKPCPNLTPAYSDNGHGNHTTILYTSTILYTFHRPDIPSFVRQPVEDTGGETMVSVCGGRSLVATTRNAVAGLSDERAVHKGTGAQGIRLWVEEYGF